MLVQATSANVERDRKDGKWHVHIHVGGEVIKRQLPKTAEDASEDALRLVAAATAKDEGYDVDPGKVSIVQ
jgi:hypothetical protein